MRIAVSGTHCCGKSTLIDEFLLRHSEFIHEPEPYSVLEEDFSEVFAAQPTTDDFYRQLEFMFERVRQYHPGDRVIFERSPVDFVAYMLALDDLTRETVAAQLIQTSVSLVTEALAFLDLILFLPIDEADNFVVADSEDTELRFAVNSRLETLFDGHDFNLIRSAGPLILEATGSTSQRLRILETAITM